MKKLFTSFAIAALSSISANAQNLQRNTSAAQNAKDGAVANPPTKSPLNFVKFLIIFLVIECA